MKITSYKKWITMALLTLVSAFGLNAQSASFATPTTNFDPAGGTATFTVSVDYTVGTMAAMGMEFTLPTGWSFGSTVFSQFRPDVRPTAGETGTVGYAYTGFGELIASSTFEMILNYPSGLTTDQVITGNFLYTLTGQTQQTVAMTPVTVAAPPTAPTITAQPMSATVNEGAGASFTVAASGSPTPTFQWKKGGVDVGGATSATYDISAVSSADAGDYTVVVTNSQGSVTSSAAILSVNAAPTISSQPMSLTVNQGQDASFSVTAAGAIPLTYQWHLEGNPISLEMGVTLQLNGVQPGNAGNYTVVVTNSVGMVTSSVATLTVIEPPTIASQPSSQTLAEGSALSLAAIVNGTTPLSLQWMKDGQPIAGATSAIYDISSVMRGDAGSYMLRATNAAGSQDSAAAVVTVQFKPVINTQPTAQTSGVGGTAVFNVEAEGLPAPTFQWRRGGADITGETGSALSLSNLQLIDDNAIIAVAVTNSIGTTVSSDATLTVNEGPAITAQPMTVSVGEGSPASFMVTATGNPAPTYQWKKDGVDISGATSATLSFSGVTKADDGEYSVVVTNTVGSVTSAKADLDVLFKPEISQQPTDLTGSVGGSVTFNTEGEATPDPTFQWFRDSAPIAGATGGDYTLSDLKLSDDGAKIYVEITNSQGTTTSAEVTLTVTEGAAISSQPVDATVNENGPFSFAVIATGNPAPTYQWKKDGVDIAGATSASYSVSVSTRALAGSYTVFVDNGVGSATSNPAVLVVQFAPEVTLQPVDTTAGVGGSATFTTDGIGIPEATIQWFRNGSMISGATDNSVTVTGLILTDSGDTFYAIATNTVGFLQTSTATLTVTEGAAISSQPVSVTVNENEPFSFAVIASGSPEPTYQWKKDGVDIAGATSAIYTTSVSTRAQAGSYTVFVDNGVGSATSTPAVLVVQYAPEVTLQPVDVVIGVGGSATFTADVDGIPAATVQWFRNQGAIDGPVVGATDVSLTLTNLQLSDSGATFYLLATNLIGPIQSSPATLTVREIPAITTQPSGGTENAAGSFTFTVVATGTPTPTYQWRKGGTSISGATSATLTLSNLVGSDAGSYDVVVTNAQGSVTSSAAELVVPTPPVITTNPVGGKKVVGESFTFSVTATGTAPLTYQWQKNGADVAGATSATLALTGLAIENGGSYTVTVTNTVGSVTSAIAVLEVDNALKAPTITRQPSDTSVRTGETATITAVVEGNPLPTYQWFKNNVAIAGQTTASLTISNAQAADQSGYNMVATNSEGFITSNLVRLTVSTADVAPVINSQPRNRTAALETSVTFSISATGVPEPTYQWKLNGVAIDGATSASYMITSVATTHAGNYSVDVTNTAGSVTSRNALLVVITQSFEGTYFGSFGTDRGQFAVTIKPDNSGTFVGFDEIAQLYVVGVVQVADDGTFSFSVTSSSPIAPASDSTRGGARRVISDGNAPSVARAEITITAQIGDNGTVTGTVEGVDGLSMSGAKEEGSETDEISGFYEASASGSDAVTYTIIAPNGKVLVFTETAAGADAGVGTVTSEGEVSVTTVANNTVTATVTATTSTIQTEITDSAGATTSFSGGDEDLIATQRLVNISSRAVAGAGEDATIAGLVITGEDSKPVLIRAVGPGLTEFGVTGVLSAPQLELFSGQTVIASNTGWATSSDSTDIIAAASIAGAFALDTANADSAILQTLPPGAYTAKVSGSDGGTGVVLVEVYDLSSPTLGQKLFNISTRAPAGSGNETVVAGFVVAGSVPKRVLMRGVGPTLGDYGVTGALADPKITLFRDTTVVATNDNWGTNAASVTAASSNTGAFQLVADSKDAAMVISLEPGVYTLHMSGVGGTSGVGLIEVYEIP